MTVGAWSWVHTSWKSLINIKTYKYLYEYLDWPEEKILHFVSDLRGNSTSGVKVLDRTFKELFSTRVGHAPWRAVDGVSDPGPVETSVSSPRSYPTPPHFRTGSGYSCLITSYWEKHRHFVPVFDSQWFGRETFKKCPVMQNLKKCVSLHGAPPNG